MPRNPNILIVSPDARLQAEVAAAFKGMSQVAPVLHYARDFRHGVETVRSRRPDFALVEMGSDLRSLKAFAEEAAVVSPETNLAAVFAPDIFGPDVSESAILIEAIRAGMQDFLRRPVSRADLEQLLERFQRKAALQPAARSGKVISFVSNKGGVGKSTVSTNVACGLALGHPEQVLLIDASLQMGVCAPLLDLRPMTSFTDAVRERDRLDETLLRRLATPHESGLHLLAPPADAVEAAEIDDQVMSRVLTLARRAYDYVLVDTFPLLDQVMMAVLDLSDRVYLVLESVVPTILGVARLIQLLDSLGLPRDRQRVILNRYTGSTDNLKPADVARRLGREVDFVVPYQKKVAIAANLGKPYILGTHQWWGAGQALRRIVLDAEAVATQGQPVRERSPGRPSGNGTPAPQEDLTYES
ncbi:MAG: AAA family ATPase [Planctomycetes bacterium]|nr:AAA family ATPase [Planctomycetota bacterium]